MSCRYVGLAADNTYLHLDGSQRMYMPKLNDVSTQETVDVYSCGVWHA